MVLIILELIIFGWVVAAFTWYRLDTFERKSKVIYILGGFFISFMITFLLCNVASIGIEFELKEIKNEILKNLILAFTPINAIVLMPSIAKIISDYDSNEIEKDEATKRVIRTFVIFIIVSIIEIIFLRSIQTGTLQYINNLNDKN